MWSASSKRCLPPFDTACPVQCIDGCSIDAIQTSERLQLLVDLSSSSGLFPEAYWITGVTKEEHITDKDVTVYRGRQLDRVVIVREHRLGGSVTDGYRATLKNMKVQF